MDELVKKIAAFGIPGIVLVIAISVSGYAGGAAIVAALAALGPFGILGGIATLGVIGLISHAIADYGTEKVIEAVVDKQLETKSAEQIIKEVEGYPISRSMKLKVIDNVKKVANNWN